LATFHSSDAAVALASRTRTACFRAWLFSPVRGPRPSAVLCRFSDLTTRPLEPGSRRVASGTRRRDVKQKTAPLLGRNTNRRNLPVQRSGPRSVRQHIGRHCRCRMNICQAHAARRGTRYTRRVTQPRTRSRPSFIAAGLLLVGLDSVTSIGVASDGVAKPLPSRQPDTTLAASRADSTAPPKPAPAAARATAVTSPAMAAFAPSENKCEPPWWLDAAGIRRIRPECLVSPARPATAAAAASGRAVTAPAPAVAPSSQHKCEPPWWLDAAGIRRIRLECLMSSSELPARAAVASREPTRAKQSDTVDCREPFWLDAHGIRRLKMACL
jgi:hypothetical protein